MENLTTKELLVEFENSFDFNESLIEELISLELN